MTARKHERGLSERQQAMLDRDESLRIAFPHLYRFLTSGVADFLGMSIIIGNRGGYLGILKKLDEDGKPTVGFCNGNDPLDALEAFDGLIEKGTFRPDKPRS